MDEDSGSASAEYHLLFVQPQELSYDELSDSIKLAFRCMDDRNFDPVWLSETECFNVLKKDPTKIFVCDPFSGNVFDHLVKTQSRVVGPQCILKCVSTNQPIPRLPNPLYSTVLKDVILTCTNMDRKQKDYIERKVQLLGGIMSKVLVPSVTHLITNDVGSKKYFVAGNLGIPLMLPSWIDMCWERSKTEDFECNEADFLKEHRCPIFKGCSITVSQISSADRMKLSRLIQSNGGLYNGSLECHKTTHLVLNEPVGKKYSSAKRWKVHCISPQWIYDSVAKDYCVDWSLYAVDENTSGPSTSTSTPEKNPRQVPRISADINKLDFSRIEPISGVTSNVDETCMTEFELTLLRDNKWNAKGSGQKVNPSSSSKTLQELDRLDLQQVKKLGLFLDGCRIYISGFSGTRLEKLQRIINFGGGTRFSQASESVTHVLTNGDNNNSDVNKLFSHEPHIVDVRWLVDSCKQKRLVAENLYYKNPPVVPIESFSPISLKNKNSSDVGKENISVVEKAVPVDERNSNETVMDDVLNQYLIPQEGNSIQELEPGNDEDTSAGVFTNLRIHVHPLFKNEDREFLVDVIESRGGLIIARNLSCNYTVVPLTADSKSVDGAFGTVVTSIWIEHCATESVLADINDNVLFKALPDDVIQSEPLKGCVITLSLYSGTERDSLTELTQALGAVCQEFFLRVPKGDALANTHLVIPENQGSKYNAAKRWGIPVVSKDWLLDAVKLGAKPDEKFYDVDNPQPNPLLAASPEPPLRTGTPECINDDDPKVLDISEVEKPKTPAIIPEVKTTPLIAPEVKTTPLIAPEVETTPLTRRKSRVDTLKESSIRRKSSIGGTPAKYLDLSAMSAAFDSPEGKKPVQRRDSNQTFQADCQHYLKMALDKHANESDNNVEETPDTTNTSITDRPLSGVTIVVSKKLAKIQGQLNNQAASLGADYRWIYDNNCTHLIHQGKPNDPSRDLRKAKSQDKIIVSPEWLTACQDENARVDESLYPYTFNPKMNLSSQITTKKCANLSSNNIQLTSNCNEQQTSPTKNSVNTSSSDSIHSPVNEPNHDFYKKLDFLMSTTKAESLKKPRSRRADSNSRRSSEVGPSSPIVRLRAKISDEGLPESVPMESQGIGPITWDDPTSRQEKEKIAEILAEQGTQGSMQDVEPIQHVKPEKSEPVDQVEEIQIDAHDASVKRFILTGFTEEEKTKIIASIRKLEGMVIDSESFDVSATHLIASKPSKTEKFFASIASGLWIVCSSYIDDSLKNGCFLPETDYEWGGQHVLKTTSVPTDSQKIALSAHRWRTLLCDEDVGKRGAFVGWKVIINLGGSMKESRVLRLLQAGCAKILDIKPPYSDPMGATHAFIDNSKKNVVQVDWPSLVKNGVLCLKMDFIAAYLRDGKNINPEKFKVDDILKIEKDLDKKRKSDELLESNAASAMKRSRKK